MHLSSFKKYAIYVHIYEHMNIYVHKWHILKMKVAVFSKTRNLGGKRDVILCFLQISLCLEYRFSYLLLHSFCYTIYVG